MQRKRRLNYHQYPQLCVLVLFSESPRKPEAELLRLKCDSKTVHRVHIRYNSWQTQLSLLYNMHRRIYCMLEALELDRQTLQCLIMGANEDNITVTLKAIETRVNTRKKHMLETSRSIMEDWGRSWELAKFQTYVEDNRYVLEPASEY